MCIAELTCVHVPVEYDETITYCDRCCAALTAPVHPGAPVVEVLEL